LGRVAVQDFQLTVDGIQDGFARRQVLLEGAGVLGRSQTLAASRHLIPFAPPNAARAVHGNGKWRLRLGVARRKGDEKAEELAAPATTARRRGPVAMSRRKPSTGQGA